MVSQDGIKYAVYIINTHFGDLVSKVCECLLRGGPLTLQQVVQSTGLTPQQAKNCLLVLVQHNCVQAFCLQEDGIGGQTEVLTQYIVLFDNILHRMRFSKFLMIVAEELDRNCIDLFEDLLTHGRLTVKQMLDRASGNQSGDDTTQSLLKLVTARFVERCPKPEPLLTTEEEPQAKRRGARSAKINIVSVSLEQRVKVAAAQVEGKRFSLSISDETALDEKMSDSPNVVGEKRKHNESSSEHKDEPSNEEILFWRVNFEEFICRLRHKAFIAYVRMWSDEGTATVLGAMLEATRTAENKTMAENTVPLSISSILEEVMKSKAGRSMTVDHVKASLAHLGSVKGSDELYTVGLKNLTEQAQNEEVEPFVLKRYGMDAYRIFRLLSKEGRLMETDRISDVAFVDKQGATKILYSLWKDGYLHMEKAEVVPNKRFLLWKVDNQSLRKNVVDEMYQAALNLSLHLTDEKEKENELLLLPPAKRVGPMKTRFDRLSKFCMLWESSMMKLDDAIMLFQNF